MKRVDIAKKLGLFMLALCLSSAPAATFSSMPAAAAASSESAPSQAPDQDTASEAQSTLELSLKTYKKTYQTKKGLVYKKLSYEYPVAKGDSAQANAFNKRYKDLRSKWIKEAKKNLKEAKELVKELTDNTGDRFYSDEVTCKITSSDDNYISILQSGYDYSMGAHGTPYRVTYIFDAKTGEEASAADILGLTPEQLNTKIRKMYLNKFDKTQESGNFLFYPSRKDVKDTLDKLDFNENSAYLKNGKVHFYVEPYTLGPYAAGYIEVSIKM